MHSSCRAVQGTAPCCWAGPSQGAPCALGAGESQRLVWVRVPGLLEDVVASGSQDALHGDQSLQEDHSPATSPPAHASVLHAESPTCSRAEAGGQGVPPGYLLTGKGMEEGGDDHAVPLRVLGYRHFVRMQQDSLRHTSQQGGGKRQRQQQQRQQHHST